MVYPPVLILMDYQEGICREDGPIGRSGVGAEVSRRGVLEAARGALSRFRSAQHPVIHVRVAFDPQYHRLTSASPRFGAMRRHRMLLESDPATQICPEVAPLPEEPVITKGCVNPFIGTHLTHSLTHLRPAELVLGGVATNHVVESTARYAADAGYPVVVLEDLCASFRQDLHDFAVTEILPAFGRVLSSAEYFETEAGQGATP